MTKCSKQVEIEKCQRGLLRGTKVVCRDKNDPDRYSRHPDEFLAVGKPTDYGLCDNSCLYLSSKETKKTYKPVISVPGPSSFPAWRHGEGSKH